MDSLDDAYPRCPACQLHTFEAIGTPQRPWWLYPGCGETRITF